MAGDWQAPTVTVTGKSKRLRDFMTWIPKVPVCSERAKSCLQKTVDSCVEFLPLVKIKGIQYHAMNTLTLVDCLDRAKSEIVYSTEAPKIILNITTYGFVSDLIPNAPVFRLPYPTSHVFVNKTFVDVVVANELTGANFADPAVNCWEYVFDKRAPNVVPGVID